MLLLWHTSTLQFGSCQEPHIFQLLCWGVSGCKASHTAHVRAAPRSQRQCPWDPSSTCGDNATLGHKHPSRSPKSTGPQNSLLGQGKWLVALRLPSTSRSNLQALCARGTALNTADCGPETSKTSIRDAQGSEDETVVRAGSWGSVLSVVWFPRHY